MSDKFKIAETEGFQKRISKNRYKKLYKKIDEYIYPMLRRNPYFGPNIKRLKGNLAGIYRYRIGAYRLFYEIDDAKILIYIIDIADRKDAYN